MWYNVYKVFLVCWIMFGLGYLFMILSFISRAMRSKTLEHLFLERLKHTHSKIWHQFTKDVVYIRRILNESYLLKFKVTRIITLAILYYIIQVDESRTELDLT